MPTKGDSESERTTRRRSPSECKSLIEAATIDLFRNNAFRITGLPVDSTTREISRHADRLKLMEELGHGASAHKSAFALKPPPTLDQIREAIQKLKDPERRIIDEFFWFWPEEFGRSGFDPAIQAFLAGDGDTALRIWNSKETNPADGVIAMHNIAVLWHLTALEWENYTASAELDKDRREKIETYWRSAFKRWKHLVVDDSFWEKVNFRIRQIDDARLTTGFARRMRASLPEALDKINAEFALRYAEAGRVDLARLHVQFMRETNQGLDNVAKVAELVLAPTKARVHEQIQRAKQTAEQNPGAADQAVRNLIAQALPLVDLFDIFFGDQEQGEKDLLDEAATSCVNCLVAYQRKTGDNRAFVELLERTLPLAEAVEVRQRIQENISIGKGNLEHDSLEPIYAKLKAVQDSKLAPKLKLQQIRSEVIPQLESLKKKHGVTSQLVKELSDSMANVLRGISIEAYNEHKDFSTALDAIDSARELCYDAALKKRIQEDLNTVSQTIAAAKENRAQDRSSNKGGLGCLVVLGIIGVLAAIGSCDSSKRSAPNGSYTTPSTPSPSSYTPPSSVGSPNSPDGGTYRVPSHVSSELSSDRQAIESAKATASQLEIELAQLAHQIESQRAYLDLTSQFAVEEFNRKVARYNAKLEGAKAQDGLVNQMVDSYNEKLRRYGR